MVAFFAGSCSNKKFNNHGSPWRTETLSLENQYIFPENKEENKLKEYEAVTHPQIVKAFGGEYKNTKLECMIAKIVGDLTAVNPASAPNYRIILLNSENVNAFALPNGYVYITRGLIAIANDCSEIAGVIAHEMAHIIAHHGLLRLEKQQAFKKSLLLDKYDFKNVSQQQIDLHNSLSLAQFSRQQELEADAIAIQLLSEANYDPFAIARFLQTMQNYAQFRNIFPNKNGQLDFLATHPATKQRILQAIENAKKVENNANFTQDRSRLLKGIDGLLFSAVKNQGFIRDQCFISPHLHIKFCLPEGFYLRMTQSAIIANNNNDNALRFDIIEKKPPIAPIAYIKSGWVKGLDPQTITNLPELKYKNAFAKAQNDKWKFSIIILAYKTHLYRFLAAAKNEKEAQNLALFASRAFQIISEKQSKNYKPLYIRIITIKDNDTIEQISEKMQGTSQKEQLFRILNDLNQNRQLIKGEKVKIIQE